MWILQHVKDICAEQYACANSSSQKKQFREQQVEPAAGHLRASSISSEPTAPTNNYKKTLISDESANTKMETIPVDDQPGASVSVSSSYENGNLNSSKQKAVASPQALSLRKWRRFFRTTTAAHR